jgi:hypothetical protein
MTDKFSEAFSAWRLADGEARVAEAKLAQAWERYHALKDSPPPEELLHAVSALRSTANDKLSQALTVMRRARSAQGSHPR